jgi:hypothetical protein
MTEPAKKRTSLLAAIRAAPMSAPFPSLDELKEMLGIPGTDTSQDADITAMMAATIAIVETYLGRGIQEFSGPEQFEPIDTRNPKLQLFSFPVRTVRTVTADGAAISGFRIYNDSGVLEWHGLGCGWHSPSTGYARDPIVVVDYDGGYEDDTWPPDLLDAVLRVFASKWQATGGTGSVMDAQAGGAVKSVTVDGLAVSYGDPNAAAAEFSGGPVPPELAGVVGLLDPYRQRLVTGI